AIHSFQQFERYNSNRSDPSLRSNRLSGEHLVNLKLGLGNSGMEFSRRLRGFNPCNLRNPRQIPSLNFKRRHYPFEKGGTMNSVRFLSAALLTCFLVACAPTSQNTGSTSSDDPAPLNNVRNEFMSAFNMGDAAKVASLYATDAVIMPTHQPVITGRDAIEN